MNYKRRLFKFLCIIFVSVFVFVNTAACDGTGVAGQLGSGRVNICHATGRDTNPYDELTLDFAGLAGHSNHVNDLIPAPANGCPSVLVTPTQTSTPTVTPTVTETPPFTATLTATPTPTLTATPTMSVTLTATATQAAGTEATITICHATGSAKNPYVMITVSVNGLNGHGKHPGDIIPAPAGGCPTSKKP